MKSTLYIKLILMALVIASCSTKAKEEKDDQSTTTQDKVYPVRVEKIERKKIEKTLDYTANLVAFKEINFAPASPGRIEKINVEVGSHVTVGQVLVETDRTQLNQALTQLANVKSNFERVDTLYQLGSISEQQYDQAKTQYDVLNTNVKFLSENTTLKSPINGIVTGKYFENGEMYSGAPNTAAGKAAVITLMQINPLKAIVNVSESYFPLVKEGMTASVAADVYPDETFNGKISRIYPTISQATRTFQVEIIIENPQEKLRPGMFTRIELNINEANEIVVPAISILKQEGTNNRYIFVMENGAAKQINVVPGKRHDEYLELESGNVTEGMDLIVEGQANLLDGSKVKVVSE